MEIIKLADYIIDLGPEGGKNGGEIVFEGKPEEMMKSNTYTASFLKKKLKAIKQDV
jgi:excinuclease ABC subunit A